MAASTMSSGIGTFLASDSIPFYVTVGYDEGLSSLAIHRIFLCACALLDRPDCGNGGNSHIYSKPGEDPPANPD